MNAAPLLLLAALSQQSLRTNTDVSENAVPYRGRGKAPLTPFFNTFRMELLLDNLNNAVATLENVNKINQMVYETRQIAQGVRKSNTGSSSQEGNSANTVSSPKKPATALGSLLNPNNTAYISSIMNALKSSAASINSASSPAGAAPPAYPTQISSPPAYSPHTPQYTSQNSPISQQGSLGGFNMEDILRFAKTIGPVISAMNQGSNT